MPNNIQVGILDDHSAVIDGYKFKLRNAHDIEIAWAVGYYSEVLPNLKKHPVDVLILDASVANAPDDANIFPILHVIPSLLEEFPELYILIISMHNRRAFIRSVMQAGASGYIVKDDKDSHEKLAAIIRKIALGEIYYSVSVATMLHNLEVSIPNLTQRQREALAIKAANPNISTRDLADKMKIAPSTARNLLSDAYTRLGVQNISGAVAKAQQLGLITPKKDNL
jgi:DNA-binding NarL/FixJ family response regulator